MFLLIFLVIVLPLLMLIFITFMRYKNNADISNFIKIIIANIIVLVTFIIISIVNRNPLLNTSDYSKVNLDSVKYIKGIDTNDVFIKMSSNIKLYKDTVYTNVTRYTGEREGFRITEDIYKNKVIRTSCTVAIAGKSEFEQNLQYMTYYLWNIYGLNSDLGKWINDNISAFEEDKKEFSNSKTFDNKNIKFEIKKQNDMYIIYIVILQE